MPDLKRVFLAAPLALAASLALAQSGLQLSLGADYAQGNYGTQVTTRQWTFPVVAKYEAATWSAKVTVPYVRIENPSVSRDGTPLPCAGAASAPRTVNGMGDVFVSGTMNVVEDRASRLLVDVTGKAKLGTADETKCLGTGENDFYFQSDVSRGFGALSLFGSLGWRKMGGPPGVDFKDPLYYSVGASYRISTTRSAGFAYDYRQKLIGNRDPLSEATLFFTHRFDEGFRIQSYLVRGFSDSSPDWGIGALATWGF